MAGDAPVILLDLADCAGGGASADSAALFEQLRQCGVGAGINPIVTLEKQLLNMITWYEVAELYCMK
jgi:hypothetical protein